MATVGVKGLIHTHNFQQQASLSVTSAHQQFLKPQPDASSYRQSDRHHVVDLATPLLSPAYLHVPVCNDGD